MQYPQIIDLFTNRPEWLKWILAHGEGFGDHRYVIVFILAKACGPRRKQSTNNQKRRRIRRLQGLWIETYTEKRSERCRG